MFKSKNTKYTPIIASVVASVMLSACSSSINKDIREANNSFRYLDIVPKTQDLKQPEGTDPLVYNNDFSLPEMTITDTRAALLGKYVDVRPPQKLIPLDNNLIVFQDGDIAQVWFYRDEYGNQLSGNDLLKVLLSFLAKNNIDVDNIDAINSLIQTDWTDNTEYGSMYSIEQMKDGNLLYRQRYLFRMLRNNEGIPGVGIQLTDNVIERSDGEEINAGLNRYEPARFTAMMANRLMYEYHHQVLKRQAKQFADEVVIDLGRDNNNLPAWLIEASFAETYAVLEQLFLDYDIKIKEYSSANGEILVDYDEPEPEFWEEHNTESWGLDSKKYLFKLGVHEGKTTITLYDEFKVPVTTGIAARMYSGFALSLSQEFKKYRSKNHVTVSDDI